MREGWSADVSGYVHRYHKMAEVHYEHNDDGFPDFG